LVLPRILNIDLFFELQFAWLSLVLSGPALPGLIGKYQVF